MSELPQESTQPRGMTRWLRPGETNVRLIYILFLIGGPVELSVPSGIGLAVIAIVGVALAYTNRGKDRGWIETHYTWIIRTFWIGLVYGLVSAALIPLMVGAFMLAAGVGWLFARCFLGLVRLTRGEPIKNPQSWML